MATDFQILMCGHNAILLQTRLWLLEGAGYRVAIASGLDEVQEILSSHQVHLLVLCHSLSVLDRRAAIHLAHTTSPNTRVMQIEPLGSIYPREHLDSVVNGAGGPKGLLAAVEGMQAQAGLNRM